MNRFAKILAMMMMAAWVPAGSDSLAQVAGSPPLASPSVPRNVVVPEPPEQPLPFSHRQHAGALEIECQSCHAGALMAEAGNVAAGAKMTFPPTDMCVGCHEPHDGDNPALAALADYHAKSSPVPWQRIYAIPEGVNWNHRTHLEAGTACETCHGPVGELERMAQVTAVTAMASCIGCHEARGAPTSCITCHSWPAGPSVAGEGERPAADPE